MTTELLDQIAEQLSLDRTSLSCALLGGGVARDPKTAKRILFVFADGAPCCVAKWCTEAGSTVRAESQQLKSLNRDFEYSPRHLGSFEYNNKFVSLETYLNGSTLEDLLSKKFVSVEKALSHSAMVFDQLYQKTVSSSAESDLKAEISLLLQQLDGLHEEKQWFFEMVLSNLSAFIGSSGCATSLVHFDFIPRNIIVVNGVAHLFDFEFSKRSHLAMCDWFRLFMYSPGLMKGRIFAPGLISELVLEHSLPRTFSGRKLKVSEIMAVSIVAYLIDFKLHRLSCPDYLESELASNLLQQLDTTRNVFQALG